MKYRVTFLERTDRAGNPSEVPEDYLEAFLEDGIVRDKVLLERDEPGGMHSSDVLDEDDDFLSVGSEVWEYDIAGGREKEFLEAVKNSQMAMECIAVGGG